MPGSAVDGIALLGFIAVLIHFWRCPPEMSDAGRRRFRLAIVLTATSTTLLAWIFAIIVWIDMKDFDSWRRLIFWLAFVDFWVNATALFNFLRVLANLLPFTKGDADDVTPAGVVLGLVVLLMQAVLAYFELWCVFVL